MITSQMPIKASNVFESTTQNARAKVGIMFLG